ncbi:NUDIX domain-containing protein [Olivibacter ginsenosidimutans]|uniref:NUDIX domain-containing protein n=1 Tax=Olivibacter ginsenosidimutans TaxID=1176537 RepID=A0ABP9ADI7_9SPHI
MKQSAGILLYRKNETTVEFFLVHPGGPFFVRKQEGYWTIPKGEFTAGEEPLHAAIREFQEETGFLLSGDFMPLNPIIQKGGKKVYCWLLEKNIDAKRIKSNTFEITWPPKSGRVQTYPEIDQAAWFTIDQAKVMINEKQVSLLEEARKFII